MRGSLERRAMRSLASAALVAARRLLDLLGLVMVLALGAAALPDAAAATRFQIGVAGNRHPDVGQTKSLGVSIVRLPAAADASPDSLEAPVAAFEAQGIRPVLLAEYGWDRDPTVPEARNVGTWARRFGTRIAGIEWGNETFSRHARGPSSGGVYGRTVAVALRAVRAGNPRVPLLVQADDGNTGLEDAVRDMFAAAPGLKRRSANIGWTIHPYGTQWMARMDRLISQVTRFGGKVSARHPIWVTEFGLATDDGRTLHASGTPNNYGWNPAMSFGEAAQILRDTVEGMRARYGSRLRTFMYFQREDQAMPGASTEREGYFGLLRKGGGDKGPLTAEFRRLATAYRG